jgi:hypothetical protein
MAEALFRGVRLPIATVLSGRWLTLYQTAHALGRRSGDIQKALRQMHAEGVLESDPEDEPEAGTRFRLVEVHEAALAEALGADQLPGLVGGNQDLLLLSSPSQTVLDEVFAHGSMAAVVSWATRLGGNQMLVAVAPKATETDYRRLVAVLEAAKIGVSAHRAATVMDGRALRATAIASRDAAAEMAGAEA